MFCLLFIVHLLRYAAHIISDFCIAFMLILAFCNEPFARCDGTLEAPIRNLKLLLRVMLKI
jgi:hypothetical protein